MDDEAGKSDPVAKVGFRKAGTRWDPVILDTRAPRGFVCKAQPKDSGNHELNQQEI